MADQLTIVNTALLKISEEQLTSLADNTKTSGLVSTLWDITLESLLNEANWSFARKRVIITPEVTAPAFGYTARFRTPADYNHLVSIGEETEVDYRVENGYILASQESLSLVYIANITDATIMGAKFTNSLVLYLASGLAYAINGNTKEAQYLEQQAGIALEKAKMEEKTEKGLTYSVGDWEADR